MWILSYSHQKISPWTNKKWKINKLATVNAIQLLYIALRANPSCHCYSVGWYLLETNYSRISFCLPNQKSLPNISFLWTLLLILRFCLRYPLLKSCFSERTLGVLLEATIKAWGYLGWKKKVVCKFRKKMLESSKLIAHNCSCLRFWSKVNCKVYFFFIMPDPELKQNSAGPWYFLHDLILWQFRFLI